MITSIQPIVLDRLVQAIADITSDLTTCPKEVKVDTNEKKKKKKKKSSNDLPVKREWGL